MADQNTPSAEQVKAMSDRHLAEMKDMSDRHSNEQKSLHKKHQDELTEAQKETMQQANKSLALQQQYKQNHGGKDPELDMYGNPKE